MKTVIYTIQAPVHGINYRDHELGCGVSTYSDPRLVSENNEKVTCPECRKVLIKEEEKS